MEKHTIKYTCDGCGKEIRSAKQLGGLHGIYGSGRCIDYDLCNRCMRKVHIFIGYLGRKGKKDDNT